MLFIHSDGEVLQRLSNHLSTGYNKESNTFSFIHATKNGGIDIKEQKTCSIDLIAPEYDILFIDDDMPYLPGNILLNVCEKAGLDRNKTKVVSIAEKRPTYLKEWVPEKGILIYIHQVFVGERV